MVYSSNLCRSLDLVGRKAIMSKMYVGYDGNYGSAEECDIVFFDINELNEVESEMLDTDPTEFYFYWSGGRKVKEL